MSLNWKDLVHTRPTETEDPETYDQVDQRKQEEDLTSYAISYQDEEEEKERDLVGKLPLRSSESMDPTLFGDVNRNATVVRRKALEKENDDDDDDDEGDENIYSDSREHRRHSSNHSIEHELDEKETISERSSASSAKEAAKFAADIERRRRGGEVDRSFSVLPRDRSGALKEWNLKAKQGANQMKLYDVMLEARIRLEPLVTHAYRWPKPETCRAVRHAANKESQQKQHDTTDTNTSTSSSPLANVSKNMSACETELETLLNQLLDLRMELVERGAPVLRDGADANDIKQRTKKKSHRKRTASEIEREVLRPMRTQSNASSLSTSSSDDEDDDEFRQRNGGAKDAQTSSSTFLPNALDVLDTWYRKAELLTGGGLAGGRGSKQQKRSTLRALNRNISKQVEAAMDDDGFQLVNISRVRPDSATKLPFGESTKLVESATDRFGSEQTRRRRPDPEIYADDRFYAALLKQFVESNGNADEDGATKSTRTRTRGGRRKNVDRRATKGRKLKYTQHPKLLNFMAPVKEPIREMDVARVYQSLFR